MNYYEIIEEHYAKGCYHYYTHDLKVYYSSLYTSRAEARRALRERHPWLDQYHVRFIRRETK